MSPAERRRRGRARRPAPAERRPEDFWRFAGEPPEPADVAAVTDPTALLRSLGPPPLPGQPEAEEAFGKVALRAAVVARALAAAAGLLDDGD